MRIGNDGRVKGWPLRSHAIGPLAITHFDGSPFWKFTSWKLPRERIEPERGVAHVKARLTTIAVDYLRPVTANRGLECAVILRATLQMLGVVGSNRQALELQSRESLVEIVEERRNGGQQLLAGRKARTGSGRDCHIGMRCRE